MKRCPITYEKISDNENYSKRGLRLLSPQLHNLSSLSFSAIEQREEALARVGKMSVQGVQMKLSAQLKVRSACFAIVSQNGNYILKPQSELYFELPENEAVTMSLAAIVGLVVPLHGLIYSIDQSMTYFIRRFDRVGRNKKLSQEDFAQLSGEDRYTKYDSSVEKVIAVIEKFCTFPRIELVKFFKLTLFNFLIGNEDMHLKNFSLITRDKKVSLSPFYDLLNSTIAQKNVKEEIALPIKGRKNNLTKRDFFEYLAVERLQLNEKVVADIRALFIEAIPKWKELLEISFLSRDMQEKYIDLLDSRCRRLGLVVSEA